MTTEIKIKEHDLHEIIRDLIEGVLNFNRPNKEKICNFIVNLVNNGGHITNAAMEAGYGPKKNKNGKELTIEETRKIAANEGSRLLENEGISKVYERLLAHRFTANIFTKSFTREHSISIYYQIAMMNYDKNPGQALKALKEASILAAHYQISEVAAAVAEALRAAQTNKDNQEEMTKGAPLLEEILKLMHEKPNVEQSPANDAIKPVNVSDVYN